MASIIRVRTEYEEKGVFVGVTKLKQFQLRDTNKEQLFKIIS